MTSTLPDTNGTVLDFDSIEDSALQMETVLRCSEGVSELVRVKLIAVLSNYRWCLKTCTVDLKEQHVDRCRPRRKLREVYEEHHSETESPSCCVRRDSNMRWKPQGDLFCQG